jgi:hypothetical protein
VTRRSEYLNAAFWAALGVIIVVASWRLDRLENLSINPWSAPGLTPGVVGVLMVLLAMALALQVRGRARGETADAPGSVDGTSAGGMGRTLLAGALCVLFAGVSLGRGLPFMAEGATFIVLFITVFSWPQWRAEGRVARGLLMTLVIAVAAAAVISWLFESVFLVRLP